MAQWKPPETRDRISPASLFSRASLATPAANLRPRPVIRALRYEQNVGLPIYRRPTFFVPSTAASVQRHFRMQRCVLARVAHEDDELARIDGPLVRRLAPVAEGARIQVQCHVPGFACGEANFLEALQFPLRPFHSGRWVGNIELGNFGA